MVEIVVFLGPPGSGKSSHCQKIKESYETDQVIHLSSGDILRGIRTGAIKSAYEAVVNDHNAPALLDHSLVNSIIFERIQDRSPETTVLIDGYPSFKDAIGVFMDAISANRFTFLGSFGFKLSRETSIRRLSSRPGRRGDRPNWADKSYMDRRYDEYLRYTLDAIATLEEVGSVIEIDAEPDLNTVWNSVFHKYVELVPRHRRVKQ